MVINIPMNKTFFIHDLVNKFFIVIIYFNQTDINTFDAFYIHTVLIDKNKFIQIGKNRKNRKVRIYS